MFHVLVPVDDDLDRARAQAEHVATRPGVEETEVTVAHALHGEEHEPDRAMRRPDRVETAGVVGDRLEDAGASVHYRALSEPPAPNIVDAAERLDADEIVMGGRKRGPAAAAVLGSVVESVMQETAVPVVVTGDEKPE